MKSKALALYNLLLQHPYEYVSEELICSSLPNDFPASPNTTSCTTLNRAIWDAVQLINNSMDNDFKFIVVNNRKRQYKIASEEDLKRYLGREHKLLSKKYKRLSQITYKASLNGVGDLGKFESDDELNFIKTIIDQRGDDNVSQAS